jgi:hypothetical protein
MAFEKSAGWEDEGLTRIFTDDTDQEQAVAGSSTALLTSAVNISFTMTGRVLDQ